MQKRLHSDSHQLDLQKQYSMGLQRNCPQVSEEGLSSCYALPWGNNTTKSPRLLSRWCSSPSQEHRFWIFLVSGVASDALQQQDLAAAYKIVDGVLQRLAQCRSEEEFEEISKQAIGKVTSVGQDPPIRDPSTSKEEESASKVTACCLISHCWPCFLNLARILLHRCFMFLWTQWHKSFRDALREEVIPHWKSWMGSIAWQHQRTGKQQNVPQRHYKLWRCSANSTALKRKANYRQSLRSFIAHIHTLHLSVCHWCFQLW